MPQDAYTLRRVAGGLNDLLAGGKISKINMPEKDGLSLIIYTRTGSVKLEISTSAKNNRISLGGAEKVNPQVAPNFCMLLRKHIQNAQITAVRQIGFERIVAIDLDCFSEFSQTQMTLYCEIMGKYSNLILTEKGVILGALKQTSLEENARRVLFSGAKYALPAPQGKADPTDIAALKEEFAGCARDEQFICARVEGIARSTAAEMCLYYGGDVTAEQVYEYVNLLPDEPCITYGGDGEPEDFKARSSLPRRKAYGDILSAQRDYYAYVCAKQVFADGQRRLESALKAAEKKQEKRLAQINAKLLECENAEEIKLKGELITANIYRIQRGMTSFEADDYYSEEPRKIKIELDRQLSPSQNAQKYYKKYAKMKRTVLALTGQRAEVEDKLGYLHSIGVHIAAAECADDLEETGEELMEEGLLKRPAEKRKKAPESAPFREYEIDGFRVICGRNNAQNDRLLKSLAPDDVWLHVNRFHSSHVGIVCGGAQVPDGVIAKAAAICAHYSEARGRDKVSVDYAPRKYVKKPPKANPGFVTYSEYSNIIVAPSPLKEYAKN